MSLSYVQELKMIRELRNMVQHAMILPVKELQTYLLYGTKFFEKTLLKFYGLEMGAIRYSSLIRSEKVKELLQRAEEKISSGDFLESIVASRDGFDYANFIYNNSNSNRIVRAPALAELKDTSSNLYSYLCDVDKRINMDMVGIENYKYQRYLEYINYIPAEYTINWHGNSVLQRPWEKRDAEFVYLFVSNAILHWESSGYEPIHKSTFNANELKIRFVEKICGVDTGSLFEEYGCTYGLDDKSARLFFTDTHGVAKIREALKIEIATEESQRYWGEELTAHHIRLLKVDSYDINCIMNDPPTWEVMIIFRYIPLANKELYNEPFVSVDENNRKSLLDAGIDDDVANIILDYNEDNAPIDIIEKAFDLE